MKYFVLTILLIISSCSTPQNEQSDSGLIKLSTGMRLKKIAPKTFVATDTDFYWSNILVSQISKDTVLIASSPFDSHGTRLLTKWIKKEFNPKKVIAINTHYHRDGIGGNEVYHQEGYETWANEKTIELTNIEKKKSLTSMLKFVKKPDLQKRIKETKLFPAKNSFSSKVGKIFKFDDEEVQVYFPGHAHSPDNVVVYLKNKKILFGGCMIKPGKDLGYLGVANVNSWDTAMSKLSQFNPQIVVPGHGKWGNKRFLDKTHQNVRNYLKSTKKEREI